MAKCCLLTAFQLRFYLERRIPAENGSRADHRVVQIRKTSRDSFGWRGEGGEVEVEDSWPSFKKKLV